MPDVSEVSEGIYQIEVNGANTSDLPPFSRRSSIVYFLTANGQTAIIETGPAGVFPAVFEAIRQLGHKPAGLSYIILTHIHLDHAGGSGTLAQQFPQLQVIVHRRGARHLVDPARLIEGTRQAFGERFEDEYGPILPIPEHQVRAVEDGEVIPLGAKELWIIDAPGHATHHLITYETKSQGIFCGDALGSKRTEGSSVRTVAGFDLDAALETIDKVSQYQPKLIFHSHGGVNLEVDRLLQSVRANTKAYGDIILEAMRAGEENEQIAQKLQAYYVEHAPSDHQVEEHRLDDIIPWYVAHFKRKGIV